MKFQRGDRVYWPEDEARGVKEQHGTIVESASANDQAVRIHFDGRAEPSELFFPVAILHAPPICPGVMVRTVNGNVYEVKEISADAFKDSITTVRRPCDGRELLFNLQNLRVVDSGVSKKQARRELPEWFRRRETKRKKMMEEGVTMKEPDYRVGDRIVHIGGTSDWGCATITSVNADGSIQAKLDKANPSNGLHYAQWSTFNFCQFESLRRFEVGSWVRHASGPHQGCVSKITRINWPYLHFATGSIGMDDVRLIVAPEGKEEEGVNDMVDYQVLDLVELKSGGTAPNRVGTVVEPPFNSTEGNVRVPIRLDGDEQVRNIVTESLQRVPVGVGSYVRTADSEGRFLGIVQEQCSAPAPAFSGGEGWTRASAQCVVREAPGLHDQKCQEGERVAAWQEKMDEVLRPAVAGATKAAGASILDHVVVTTRDAVVIQELQDRVQGQADAINDLKLQVKRLLASELRANEIKNAMERALGHQQRLVSIAKRQLGERAWQQAEREALEQS